MSRFEKILVPVDFSEHSRHALEVAVDLAKAFEGRIELLHCYQIQPAGVSPYGVVLPESFDREVREAAARHLEEWQGKVEAQGVPVESHLSASFPAMAIAETAADLGCDLIVMGTRGNTGLKHVLLGSVAERTLRSAACPVLTVKAPDDED